MAKYLTRQRKRLLEYLSEHTDEQMSARQIADALAVDEISVSAVYRNLSALEEEGLLKRSVREGTREIFFQYIAAEECKDSLHLSCRNILRRIKSNWNDLLLILYSAYYRWCCLP